MPTTYTIHDVDCPSATNGPQVAATSYPTARKHKCIYGKKLPSQVRVTSTDEVVPEPGVKADPGSGTWVRPVPDE